MKKRTIVFTGGGSAGHVTPNLAIIKELDKNTWNIQYIGSKQGIERELIEKAEVPYHGISSGKLRRYFDLENAKDVFRVLRGCFEARSILKRLKPRLVFSKGGFVSVPVVIAARTLKIPIFIHESDMTPGLANKISQRFATKIFTSFEETVNYLPANKTHAIGSPIRREILSGSSMKGKQFLVFDSKKPVLTIMGGSLGARRINEAVRAVLPKLAADYQIVHICGKNNLDDSLSSVPGYRQFEYIHDELPDILAATDIVITRGGSNSIFEFLALEIPMVIIPLTLQQSRGDQILNARSFEEKGYSITLQEENLTEEKLLATIEELREKSKEVKKRMRTAYRGNALDTLLEEISKVKS
ncbi:undecaprenyldiphospho-muramoylpentapeptide beta-N-acetylglucosaminyltransferase [Bacillus sp. FJAT-27445]|uniref:undecaprenyldiphospho-muramoylpentapeptide beta-N-acetylglucosaminyltransferase n=1 Tax=Bacillus sp. FJAT-27445 TaxID=1679166 RepID=UPI000743CF66|nr:undecaprenyldiphospho-muramoylpentapeptide beta-N-acetylglucosaminyltransferase [Bacillus sp. FJAT-27445]